jgi:hydroxyacylglutathione hydrolase
MQAKELVHRMKSKEAPPVVDVRSGGEYASGHIPGAIHAPAWKIAVNIADLPKDKNAELVITCEHGPRAQTAHSLLSTYGYRNIKLLEGHMSGWRRAGLPLEK